MKSHISLDDDVGIFCLLGHQNSRGLVIFPFQLMGVSYVGFSIPRTFFWTWILHEHTPHENYLP